MMKMESKIRVKRERKPGNGDQPKENIYRKRHRWGWGGAVVVVKKRYIQNTKQEIKQEDE